jgi:integrase
VKTKRIRPRESRGLFYRNGGWWIDVQINGKRYREYAGPTEGQARLYRNKLVSWKRDVKNGLPSSKPEGEPMRFETFADDYLELYAKRKRSFDRDDISIRHLKDFFKGWMFKDVDSEAVARYRASRKGKSVATVNRELACLRTALRKAVEWGKLPAYPLPKERLLGREPEFKPRILEPEESRALIAVADPKWLRPAIIIWLNTGLRKRELLRLRRADVDLKKRTLTVVSAHAKNGKERTMPINKLVAETLKALPGETYFFENPETGKPVLQIDGAWRTAKTRAGINGRLRIHDCRDTFATLALRGDPENNLPGADIRTVAELIGDDPATALKRYCLSDERTKRTAVDRMAGIVLGSRQEVHEASSEDIQPASESVS